MLLSTSGESVIQPQARDSAVEHWLITNRTRALCAGPAAHFQLPPVLICNAFASLIKDWQLALETYEKCSPAHHSQFNRCVRQPREAMCPPHAGKYMYRRCCLLAQCCPYTTAAAFCQQQLFYRRRTLGCRAFREVDASCPEIVQGKASAIDLLSMHCWVIRGA